MLHTPRFLIAATAAFALCASSALAQPATDYTILEIDGDPVEYSDVRAIWTALFNGQEAPNFDEADPKIKRNVLRGVIGEYLLYKKATESNIPERPDVKQRLERLKKKVIVEAYLDEKTASAVTPANVKARYETLKDEAGDVKEARASHILVEDEDTAKKLRKEIANGASFAEVAKKHSDDKGSAVSGGDLGYFTKDKMVPEFAEAAFALDEGDISDPVKSPFGWHIIKLVDKRDAAFPPFMDMRGKIEAELQAEALKQYIDELVANSEIVMFNKEGKKEAFDVLPSSAE